jgi:hypothetical protein
MKKEEIEKLAENEYPMKSSFGLSELASRRRGFTKGYQQAQKDFLTWYTTGNNKHYVGDKLIEAYKKEVLNQ